MNGDAASFSDAGRETQDAKNREWEMNGDAASFQTKDAKNREWDGEAVVGISPYIRQLREKVGNDLLLLPGVSAIILDGQNRVLLHRASDDGRWYTIGGAIDPGEEPAAAAVREAHEETGLEVEAIRVLAVKMSETMRYPNGHQVQYVTIAFLCRILGGSLRIADDESLEVRFFAGNELPDLPAEQLQLVRYALDGREDVLFKHWPEKTSGNERGRS